MKVNQVLTQYATGVAVDMNRNDNSIKFARFLAPEVVVGGAVGQYKAFDNKDAFQVVDTSRAVGGGAKRLEFSENDAWYNCKPNALEITIDKFERDQAGEGDLLGLQRAKISNLITVSGLSYANRVITAAKSVSAVAGVGNWSNASVDPVAEFDALIEDLATKTNRYPDRLAISLNTWKILKNHPKVIGRFTGITAGVTMEQFKSLLLYSDFAVMVGSFGYDQKKSGSASKNMVNMLSNDLFLFHASDTPTQYDPSFMKTFRTRSGGVDSVREYKSEDGRQDVYALDWTEDLKITGSESVRRATIT